MGYGSRYEAGPVGPVEANEATVRPLGEGCRPGARAKSYRTVERLVKTGEAVSDVELTRGGGGCWAPYPHRGAKDRPSLLVERGFTASPIDDEMGVEDFVGPQGAPGNPSGLVRRQRRQSYAEPLFASQPSAAAHYHD